jgi:hypothetical protein
MSCSKITWNWIIELNVIGEIQLGDSFLFVTPKLKATEEQIGTFDLIKVHKKLLCEAYHHEESENKGFLVTHTYNPSCLGG